MFMEIQFWFNLIWILRYDRDEHWIITLCVKIRNYKRFQLFLTQKYLFYNRNSYWSSWWNTNKQRWFIFRRNLTDLNHSKCVCSQRSFTPIATHIESLFFLLLLCRLCRLQSPSASSSLSSSSSIDSLSIYDDDIFRNVLCSYHLHTHHIGVSNMSKDVSYCTTGNRALNRWTVNDWSANDMR